MEFIVVGPFLEQTAVCVPIIRSLPDWFGIEEAIQEYAAAINTLPTFLAKSGEQVLGFLSLKQHNPYSAEIYIMGVSPEARQFHPAGGWALMVKAETYARNLGIEYLQVKTLGPSSEDANYARTRAFYEAMGFRPLEEFKQIWDEYNPCLVMVKRLS